MTKAAIYARYSSDLQTDASIEDQIRLLEEYIEKQGWQVAQKYTDHGISGASMMRPGIQSLMQDAADGKFDIVLAEALDRLSRDQEDIAGIYKRLHFSGVPIYTLSEGEISNLHIGLKGTMNAMFLKDLADKTRRGLRGRIEKGKSGGGKTYGYDIVKRFDENGEPVLGERKINKEHAKIVTRILTEYAEGKSPLAIAKQLNKEGVPGPGKNGWQPSTINGNRDRGTGILNNELYIGKLVWNRLRYIKNPDTGKRVSRLNPENEWIITEVPELRIIDDELWQKVRLRQEDISRKPNVGAKQRPKLLFSGLLKCGCCGGGFTKISKNHYGCFTARKKSMCDNFQTIRQDELEKTVISVLKTHLMNPKMCDIFCKEYATYINELHKHHHAQKKSYERELQKRIADDDRMIRMVLDGVASTASMKDRINTNAYRIEDLKKLLAQKEQEEQPPVLLHPNMAHHFQKEVKALLRSLNKKEFRHEAADLIRKLIEKVVLTPKKNEPGLYIDLKGDLAGILLMATKTKKPSEQRELIQQIEQISEELNADISDATNSLNMNDIGLQEIVVAGGRSTSDLHNEQILVQVQDSLVAGAGFEPATFRL